MIEEEQRGMNGGEYEIFQVTFPEFSLKYWVEPQSCQYFSKIPLEFQSQLYHPETCYKLYYKHTFAEFRIINYGSKPSIYSYN
jgi:hypothetical protein